RRDAGVARDQREGDPLRAALRQSLDGSLGPGLAAQEGQGRRGRVEAVHRRRADRAARPQGVAARGAGLRGVDWGPIDQQQIAGRAGQAFSWNGAGSHRRAAPRYLSTTSTSPSLTGCASLQRISATLPSSGASTGISIFMLSRMTSTSPAFTSSPTFFSIFQTVPVMSAGTSMGFQILSR